MGLSSEFEFALSVIQQKVKSSDLLTGSYARYLPLLADGLRFFLERLSPARLEAILGEQMELPAATSIAARISALLLHVPALHKLGQVVSRDRRLDPLFRKRLQPLESLPPRVPMAEIIRLVDAGFPGWSKTGITLGDQALAQGSVAVIMPFTWKRRSTSALSSTSQGVFKLLKPGIKETLDEDLCILGLLGDFLDEDCARYHLPPLDYREQFTTIRDLLMHEVRLDEEQAHLGEAARLYAASPTVLIPSLFPFCSPVLTAMERVEGRSLDDTSSVERGAQAQTIAQALIAHPLFSTGERALFHADPHAGNLMVTPGGRLAILDWSLTGRLSRQYRVQLVQLLLASLTLDQARMERIVRALSRQEPDAPALRRVLLDSLRALRWGERPGISWLTALLDNLALEARVQFNGDLLLFRKSLLTLEGVLADLVPGGGANQRALLDQTMLTTFLGHWLAEWPQRLYAPLTFRSAGTHVSCGDVLSLIGCTPFTMAKWWVDNGLEYLWGDG